MALQSPRARPESLAQQAYGSIRRAIRDGKIARGQIFSENTLAASLEVSRTPVREALLTLFQEGVVEIIPKRGYRLAELDEHAIGEILLLRQALERLIVRRLCETATPEDLQELRTVLKGKGRSQGDMFTVDEAFHLRMAELAGLMQTERILLGLRGKMYLIAAGVRVPALRNEDVAREHAAIIDALERRDCAGVMDLMSEHVERSIAAFVTARAGA